MISQKSHYGGGVWVGNSDYSLSPHNDRGLILAQTAGIRKLIMPDARDLLLGFEFTVMDPDGTGGIVCRRFDDSAFFDETDVLNYKSPASRKADSAFGLRMWLARNDTGFGKWVSTVLEYSDPSVLRFGSHGVVKTTLVYPRPALATPPCGFASWKLVDCNNSLSVVFSNSELADFNGKVVKSADLPNSNCWAVSDHNDFEDVVQSVAVDESYDDCDVVECSEPVPQSCIVTADGTDDTPFHTYCLQNLPTNTVGSLASDPEFGFVHYEDSPILSTLGLRWQDPNEPSGVIQEGDVDVCDAVLRPLYKTEWDTPWAGQLRVALSGRWLFTALWAESFAPSFEGVENGAYYDIDDKLWHLKIRGWAGPWKGEFNETNAPMIWHGTKSYGPTPAGTYSRIGGADTGTPTISVVRGIDNDEAQAAEGSFVCNYLYGPPLGV